MPNIVQTSELLPRIIATIKTMYRIDQPKRYVNIKKIWRKLNELSEQYSLERHFFFYSSQAQLNFLTEISNRSLYLNKSLSSEIGIIECFVCFSNEKMLFNILIYKRILWKAKQFIMYAFHKLKRNLSSELILFSFLKWVNISRIFTIHCTAISMNSKRLMNENIYKIGVYMNNSYFFYASLSIRLWVI